MDIGNLSCDAPAVHLPAGLMGIDKGQKDQSPLLYFYLTIDVGRRVSVWGSGADSEILE